MQIDVTKKLFTVDEYRQMAVGGIIGPDERLELIDGEIIKMSPIGHRHAGLVIRATRLFSKGVAGRALVNVQNPVALDKYNEPQPDLMLLKPRSDDYISKDVSAEDALLVVEISDSTLGFDRNVKLPKYAAAGIPEVWIENLEAGELLIYRNPVGDTYTTAITLRRGDAVCPLALPDVTFSVTELLG